MFEKITFHDDRWYDVDDLLNEEWRDVQDYEGVYQVSNYGRIKRVEHTKVYKSANQSGKFMAHYRYDAMILKPCFDSGGYIQIHLCRHQKKRWTKIHRLVAEAFLPNPDNLPQVNHKDGNKENSRLDNLEWVSMSDNMQHAYKTGLNFGRVKAILQFDLNGNFVQEFKSITEAAKAVDRNPSSIQSHLKGKTTQCGGYMWKLKENA